jgi:hypothetical protein
LVTDSIAGVYHFQAMRWSTTEYFNFLTSPGRFFAATELKSIMAYILLKYDVKFASDMRPKNLVFAGGIVPDPNAKVMFRLKQKQ